MNLGLSLGLNARGPGAAPYEPATILANIAHAYRADLGIALNAGNVAQWNDQIGTAHLVQATPANQPAYNATDATYNNQASIQAPTAGKFLAATGVVTTQPVTFWVVGQANIGSTVLVALSTNGPYIANSALWSAYAGAAVADAANAINTKRALLAIYNGAASFAGCDNWLTGGVSGNAGPNNGIFIGVLSANGSFGTIGKISEFIIQAGTPTAGEKTAMAAYLSARYGITIT